MMDLAIDKKTILKQHSFVGVKYKLIKEQIDLALSMLSVNGEDKSYNEV